MLHELSLERNRLKNEQTKLERISAGLMIDLQSSLITSDDNVVVSAPKIQQSDSEPDLGRLGSNNAKDDIDVSTRTTTPFGGLDQQGSELNSALIPDNLQIRTAKSHSPGRTNTPLGGPTVVRNKAPPSPPYGQITPTTAPHHLSIQTPTRVNFRTGMSGHRALTSSHSHPHDFLSPGAPRSMSNHAGAGILGSKKTGSGRRSLY